MPLSSLRPLAVFCVAAVCGVSTVQAAAPQTLYNFVKPMDVVQVTTQDATLPSLTAEVGAGGEILRRLTFNPAQQPSLRLTPRRFQIPLAKRQTQFADKAPTFIDKTAH